MAETMKCPGCGKKLSVSKHYDATFEWFECPRCEGCFTYDEIIEGGGNALEEAKPAPKAKKSKKSKAPAARGKKRREILDAEAEHLKEFEAEQAKPRPSADISVHHRDEVRTKEVVNIMADEIQAIYHEFGYSINEINAQDKALILWRDAKYYGRGSAREQTVEFALCGDHEA